MKTKQTRAKSSDATDPPGRLRLKLVTADDVRRELGRIYREGKSGQRDIADVSRLANVLQILNRCIEAGDLERRIEALETTE
ncbi:MAG: hypothetical protein D4R79_02000 [Comamonadaceae bacterium]|nr:MAG: hypothetical protein D4R79_02000 [Comamonadaceae bacterium]